MRNIHSQNEFGSARIHPRYFSAALAAATCAIACTASTRPDQGSPLRVVARVPLPNAAKRLDYQSLDATTGRLYISHMGVGKLIVFDTKSNKLVANLLGYEVCTGVLAVPEEGKLYVSAAGTHEVVVTDIKTLKPLARIAGAQFPDGIAYATKERKIFVSDESGGIDLIIDAKTNKRIGIINLGGEAGNTHYDSVDDKIWTTVQTKNEIVEIDPSSEKIIGRFPLPGSEGPHGFLIDEKRRLAYITCEDNNRLLVATMPEMKVVQTLSITEGPDVLALDSSLQRLYIGCEGGAVEVFETTTKGLKPLGKFEAPNAHTVSVDLKTHHVFLPLKDVNGKPELWILAPNEKGGTPPNAKRPYLRK